MMRSQEDRNPGKDQDTDVKAAVVVAAVIVRMTKERRNEGLAKVAKTEVGKVATGEARGAEVGVQVPGRNGEVVAMRDPEEVQVMINPGEGTELLEATATKEGEVEVMKKIIKRMIRAIAMTEKIDLPRGKIMTKILGRSLHETAVQFTANKLVLRLSRIITSVDIRTITGSRDLGIMTRNTDVRITRNMINTRKDLTTVGRNTRSPLLMINETMIVGSTSVVGITGAMISGIMIAGIGMNEVPSMSTPRMDMMTNMAKGRDIKVQESTRSLINIRKNNNVKIYKMLALNSMFVCFNSMFIVYCL